ncbi:Spo11/DNA topoisomerase VI subunit A [Limtongia smithiae]|uniref:Spo11/DNA topoisomerase VI subunit A n=1 Tax=Limtongia smithiae TaxID=1125753 RepID=UPI0034CF1AD2
MLDGLATRGVAEFKLANRRRQVSTSGPKVYQKISFPGPQVTSPRRFAALLNIITIIIAALEDNAGTMTKRDLYYRNSALFGNQTVVDRIIDDLACTLDVERSALGIVAAQKGLFCASPGCGLRIVSTDGRVKSVDDDGVQLIPAMDAIVRIESRRTDYVLVIEKEAVFKSLCDSEFCTRVDIGHGILITGKGYPDLLTRQFLSRVANSSSPLSVPPPVLCVVDADAYGLHIFAVYKYGSRALAHEGASALCPLLHWLGAKILDYPDQTAYVPMTQGDRKKAMSLLEQHFDHIDLRFYEVVWILVIRADFKR